MLGGIDLKSKMERCFNCKNRFKCLTDRTLVCVTAIQKEYIEYFKGKDGLVSGTSYSFLENVRIDYEPIKENLIHD